MPKIVDRDEYRRELLKGCFALFSRKGYADVTMREIARELNVSTGTLYHYFPTKKDVFEQLFEQESKLDIAAILKEIRPLRDQDEIYRRIAAHWERNRAFYQNIMLLAVDFYRSNGALAGQEAIVRFSDTYRKAIAAYLNVTPKAASFIFITVIGLMYHSLLAPAGVDFGEQLGLLKTVVDAGSSAGRRRKPSGGRASA
ncbi:MAG: TetR/AcrR family transcriptional regulator [Spirochaetes bacterium]|jgi:AcrR family transcriptional regulator|nr:TetR/AcrR family transcriptional regulator [Spirochaetota bacterium]